MKVKFKKLTDGAKAPSYGSYGAAGADLYAVISDGKAYVSPRETAKISTGIAVEIPEGYVGLIFARSGKSIKEGLAPANKVGVIDSDYRGEIIVALHNHSEYMRSVDDGERIAQLAIMPVAYAEFVEAEELSDTKRGDGGFGSTGKK